MSERQTLLPDGNLFEHELKTFSLHINLCLFFQSYWWIQLNLPYISIPMYTHILHLNDLFIVYGYVSFINHETTVFDIIR